MSGVGVSWAGWSKEIGDRRWGSRRSVVRPPPSVIRLIDIVKDVTVASASPALAPLLGARFAVRSSRRGDGAVAALGGRRQLPSVVRRLSSDRLSRCEGVYAERGLGWGLSLREILRASA